MQTIRCSTVHKFLAAAVLSASLGCAAPVFATTAILNPDGTLTYLGMLGRGSNYASGISDAGQVAGNFYNTADGSYHAFITGPNGMGVTYLDTGGTYSKAISINNAGRVFGYSDMPGGLFITGPNGVGTISLRNYSSSSATGINDAGQVVGGFTVGGGSRHAFIAGPNGGGVTDLGALGGGESYASGINDAGQVVGDSTTANGQDHAFITGPNGVGMRDLGTLGGADSYPYGINDAGQVFGYADTADGSLHAFITGPNGMGMTDLNSLAVNLPAGLFIVDATAINDHGQILVAVSGVPEPETYALLLAGLILLGFSARLRKAA